MSTTRPIRSIIVSTCFLISVSSVLADLPSGKGWTGGVSCYWDNPSNWELPGVPGPGDRVVISPINSGIFPVITGSANASCVGIQDWTWTGSNQNVNLTLADTADDVNFGAFIRIVASANGNIKGALNVYGGTLRTPNPYDTTIRGLLIGGGSNGYGDPCGFVSMYGGLITVNKIALQHGIIDLYGGTLQCISDGNFSILTSRTDNQLKVNGGTLLLNGNQITTLNALITNGFVVCQRGTLGTPAYDGTWTTLTAFDINYLAAWNPQPPNNAIEVHYKIPGDGNSLTLSWNRGDYDARVINQNVYFGTASTALVLQGTRYDATNDPCNWTIADFNFKPATSYYWRVDEVNTVNGAIATGWVWKFTTHNGKAYNPKPADAGTGLNADLKLRWTAGDWAAQHIVFVGTNWTEVFGATTNTAKIYRGIQTGNSYDLRDLANPAKPWYGQLVAGTTYYWRVTEANGTTLWGNALFGSNVAVVWSFTTAAYLNIDDFEDSQSTADVNINWPNGYAITGCTDQLGYAGRSLVVDSTGHYLQYTYNNGGYGLFGQAYSEIKHSYSGSTSFTGGGIISPALTALRIDYLGAVTNAANYRNPDIDPPYNDNDQMYVAIEDTAGNVSVYLNPDHYAQRVTNWTSWYTNIYDINNGGKNSNGVSTNLNAITGFSIGFGVRCDDYDFDINDENSVVMFDNIRLYASWCVPQYGPTADFDGDCDVDLEDLRLMAQDWLHSNLPCSGGPCPLVIINLGTDLNHDGTVDFKDFAILGNEWRTEKLWP